MYINVLVKDVAAAREFYTKWAWFIHSFGEQKTCLYVPFLLEKASRAFIVSPT
jgi:predicted lactoylglutathione lyase